MDLNDLLNKKSIDPKQVIVFRHRPPEAKLLSRFLWLAAEKPDVFNAYQQGHDERVENALQKAKYAASFIGHKPGQAIFVGLYSVNGYTRQTRDEYYANDGMVALKGYGLSGETKSREFVVWFDLRLVDFYGDWKGKLIVDWPPPEISWWRWAGQNSIRIRSISPDNLLTEAKRPWDQLVLGWDELDSLTTPEQGALAEWRGIYYIFDASDGKGYVGSAYGEQNLLGRWREYRATGHGGNKYLRDRDPKNFKFSILQLLPRDAEKDEVIGVENTWKERLHTRRPHGLNDN